MSSPENLVVVHISATAVYAVIACVVVIDDIRILGLSEVKINDFYQGHILNQERLKKVIKQAIQEAEDMANCRVHSVWLSFSTPELLSTNSHGKVYIDNDVIAVKDIVDALGQAKQKDMPKDHYLMQHVQQGVYIDDDNQLIEDPIGSFADEMTVMYHLMMFPVRSRQNMEELFRPANVRVDHIIFDAVSSAEYSLIADEREQGICFIDIGYSSTSVCVYKDNKLLFTACLAEGAHKVTMDISSELGLTMLEAEKLKKHHGTANSSSIDSAQFLSIKRTGNDDELTINLHELSLIIEARYMEIYNQAFSRLQEIGLVEYIDRGVVLSGGGSKMNGLITFSKNYLNMPVMLTNINTAISASEKLDQKNKFDQLNRTIKNPRYFTAFGALLYSQSEQFRHSERSSDEALIHSHKLGWINKLHELLKRVM